MSSAPPEERTGVTLNQQKGIETQVDITVNQLGKKFNREWVFRGLSYTFQAGQTYAITGPNGSGKSTLLQVLWGQMPPTSGSLVYQSTSGEIPGDEIFRRISIATPYLDLIDEFTLLEQLHFHFKFKSVRSKMNEEELLNRMGLAHAKNKYIANFSSGMKQRLKLSLALFSQADIIFLDEPGTNLDRHSLNWYLDQLYSLPKNCLVFIASNQEAEYPTNAQKLDMISFK